MNCPQCGGYNATQKPCSRCGFTPLLVVSQAEQMSSAVQSGSHVISTQTMSPRLSISPLSIPKMSLTLTPEMSLQKNHYILVEQLEKREWNQDAYEARWLAQNMESGENVIICEVALPLSSVTLQQFLRSATKMLATSSNHTHTTQLLDVFMEYGYGFFVFVHPVGESLQARIQRGEVLSEHEAITCYLQMAETLLFFSQQRPEIVHGSIQPNHIVKADLRWVITNGSVLAAGRVEQFISHENSNREVVNDSLTPISDLHALAKVMYVAVTGTVSSSDIRRQQAQLANARLSPLFTTIILKGIHPQIQERYQHPFDIVQALRKSPDHEPGKSRLERRSTVLKTIQTQQSRQPLTPLFQPDVHPVIPQPIAINLDRPEQREKGLSILPYPGELPSIPHIFDALQAIAWAAGILFCGTIFLLLAR